MPTISGFRRRGFTPESIRSFAKRVGITKHNSTTDIALLNLCIREHLNRVCSAGDRRSRSAQSCD